MNTAPTQDNAAIAPKDAAPQHGPRPLPLFLNILMAQTRHDPVLRARALAGLRRYQEAVRPPHPTPARVHAQVGSATLSHFGSVEGDDRAPVVLIPSLINPPHVLDLSARTSLIRWLVDQGHDGYLVDWGHPGAGDSMMDLGGHIAQRLVPLLQSLDPKRAPILVGYCLGGTLAIGAAASIPVAALATIAAPWQFDGFPDETRESIAKLWAEAKPMCDRLGYVPMEVLQSGFWALDSARTICKYADFADLADDSEAVDAFVAVEDWANAGAPLTFAAGRELFEALYVDDVTGRAEWRVGDAAIRPADFAMPTLAISSTTDTIVPAASTPPLAEQWTLDMGHVGMIVGSRGPKRLWEPLSQWLFKHGG
ncbi:alpha/beta hydrolase [Sphingobium sp. BS19]|uniref:alpha/beta hydrolase n=1 Tax=Sphingobium sp. BS19 TaxID=3018973 RepID=UPI002491B4AB|nr:alpha/beta hydrolase [Sphingobium sp. BS19]